MDRDRTKQLEMHRQQKLKEHKEKILQRTLVRSVETGANGTQNYVLKEGQNAGKVAKRDQ
jgi:hypothetical protein